MRKKFIQFIPGSLFLVMILLVAGLTALAQEPDQLGGSMSGALAWRQAAPGDVTGQRGAILSMEPGETGLNAIPVTGQADAVHLLGDGARVTVQL